MAAVLSANPAADKHIRALVFYDRRQCAMPLSIGAYDFFISDCAVCAVCAERRCRILGQFFSFFLFSLLYPPAVYFSSMECT